MNLSIYLYLSIYVCIIYLTIYLYTPDFITFQVKHPWQFHNPYLLLFPLW